ncbi:hypothetical protein [Moorena sp. SIO4A1]|uniref:hypothetical protein n=1 Tax=Moorena sp. SIO4A1 TaxID=2607835 RepID=UPI0025D361EA|nr:hypothetical protein [Moorena sp. SIO4A1]
MVLNFLALRFATHLPYPGCAWYSAITTLYLTAQGTEVVAQGKRRMVDPHWRTRQQLSKNWLVMGKELL